MRSFLLLLLLAASPLLHGGTADVIRTVGDLSETVYDTEPLQSDIPFAVDATITFVPGLITDRLYKLTFTDGTRHCEAHCLSHMRLAAGDRVRLSGRVHYSDTSDYNYALITNADVHAHGPVPAPFPADAAAVNRGDCLDRVVRIEGTVLDAFRDEIDADFVYLVVLSGDETIMAACRIEGIEDARIAAMHGATVSLTGLCLAAQRYAGRRRFGGEPISVNDWGDIRVLRPGTSDPFDAPDLNAEGRGLITRFDQPYRRRKVTGRVLAVWHGDRALIRTGRDTFSTVRLTGPERPQAGDSIDAVGFPSTDFFTLNLERAIWRKADFPQTSPDTPRDVSAREIFADDKGRSRIDHTFHGSLVRLSGTVHSVPRPGSGNDRLLLDCDAYTVPVDLGPAPAALAGLEPGCRMRVTGVCIAETENWRPQIPFPHIESVVLVIRTADDVTILSYPPQRIVVRALTVTAAVLLLLAAFLLWRTHMTKVSSRLRLAERTRLAVELHDSIAQNLTGVALEINAAQIAQGADEARTHLTSAAQTLKSCRRELRNCIWDLRSAALDHANLPDAIRQMLAPQIGDTQLAVRFPVPRSRFSDNSAYAVLRIIRELASNAVRHGHATSVRVAGSCEDGKVLFSVQDNGTGFDPDVAPGILQGHYGLQGIRERLETLEGGLAIASKSGKGTKVTAWIRSEC